MTVCSNAEKNCPIILEFNGKKLHHSFIDPANAIGSKDEILNVFRQMRDEIRVHLKNIMY